MIAHCLGVSAQNSESAVIPILESAQIANCASAALIGAVYVAIAIGAAVIIAIATYRAIHN